jgi:hypothetical protein
MEQAEQWREYLEYKKRVEKRRFVSSLGNYGCRFMTKHGFYLDLYDVRERYKMGGNDAIHKIKNYDTLCGKQG